MTLFTNQQALAQSGDTDSIQARRVLDRSDTLYTRMEKIRQIAAIKASVGPDMPPDHFHLNGKTVEDLQSMLPKGVGPSTAPHINKWLRNGIEDINQLSAEITYVKAKVLLYSRPDEWTKMMFDEASSNLCTVKRKNSKKLQLVAQYLYKTDVSQVLDHCPGVIYKKASFIRGDRYACVFSEKWFSSLIVTRGLISKGTRLVHLPFLNEVNKLVIRTAKTVETDCIIWNSDVSCSGYYTCGSIYRKSVGKHVDGTDKIQECSPTPPVWFDPYQSLVGQLSRCDVDL